MAHWETWFLDFLKVPVNCSSNRSYGDFHPCSTFWKFGSGKTQNTLCLLWNTGKPAFLKVTRNSWNHLFYDEFDVCSTFCKFQHFVDIRLTKISIPEVYPLRFSGIQRKMHFRHYGSLSSLIFWKLPWTAQVTGFMVISVRVVYFSSFVQ